jgi:hypothetical protein
MVKRSGESFSTPPRAARSRLATADLKRLTSARSNFRQRRWGHLWATCFRSSLQRPSFLKSSGPQPPGPKPPVNRHDLKHTQPSRTPPLPTICIQSYFARGASPRGSQDLVGGGKRQKGGGLCHNYFPTRFWQFFRVRVFPVTRFVLAVRIVTPTTQPTQMVSQRCDGPTNVSVSRAVFADAVSGGTPKKNRRTAIRLPSRFPAAACAAA